MKDLGAVNAKDLLVYTTSGETGGVGGNFSNTLVTSSPAFFDDTGGGHYVQPNSDNRLRGLAAADVTRNFFISDIPLDSYNVDRVDIQRGANSILFGLASPGGVINYALKQPVFKNTGSVTVRVDQYGSMRSSVDYNAVLVPQQLALRVDLLNDQTKYEQQEAWKHDKRAYAALRYDPEKLNTPNVATNLNLSYEIGSLGGADPQAVTPRDDFSTWWTVANQGRNVPVAPTLNSATGKYVGYTNAALGYNNAGSYQTDSAGNVLHAGSNWVGFAGRWTGLAAVFPDPNSSMQGGGGSYAWLQAGDSLTLPGESGSLGQIKAMDSSATILGKTHNQVGFWSAVTLSNPQIFDFYHHILGGPNRYHENNLRALNASIDQTFFQNQFGYQIAFDKQNFNAKQTNPSTFAGASINIDINTKLADGSPNPNFGRPFVATDLLDNFVDHRTRTATRGTAFWDLDFRKKLEKGILASILGRHVFTGLWSTQSDEDKGLRYSSSVIQGNYGIPITSERGNIDRVSYVGPSFAGASSPNDVRISPISAVQDPRSGLTGLIYIPTTHGFDANRAISVIDDTPSVSTFSPSWTKQTVESSAVIWQGHLLEDVIVPTIGYRKDIAKIYQSNNAPYDPVTGYNIVDDPTLWYLPTAATNTVSARNTSYSLVVHTPKTISKHLPLGMEIDLIFDKSQNFSPSVGIQDIYGRPQPQESGQTKDYGMRLSLFDRRLSFRVIKFDATAQNTPTPGGVNVFYLEKVDREYWNSAHRPDNITDHPAAVAAYVPVSAQLMKAWNWSVYTDPSSGVQTVSGSRPAGLADIADTATKGYEFELLANPTRGWNLTFNASKVEAMVSNNLKDLTAFMDERMPIWLGPAGDMLRTPGASTPIRDYAITNLVVPYLTALSRNGNTVQELRKWRWNLVTDYTIHSGRLKGLDFGGAIRWQDKVAMGYGLTTNSAGGTIYDIHHPYFGPSETNYDMWLGYTHKLSAKLTWKVQLNARNVFQSNHLIPIGAQPDGSISAYRIAPETTYFLTNTISF